MTNSNSLNNSNIIGKANTLLYSNGDISATGIINVTKLKKFLQENEGALYKDSSGNEHCFVKMQKLKKPFERHTHMIIFNAETQQKSDTNDNDDLPF